jgi:hypothetical protein
MVAIEVASKVVGLTLGPSARHEEVAAKMFEFADKVEADLLDKERRWELAVMPYPDYLQTPEWQAKRAQARDRAGGRCQICNSDGPA